MALIAPSLEFSRPLEVARIPALGSTEKISATPEECKRLAKRLDVPAVHALRAVLLAKPWRGGGVKLTGDIHVDLEQVSVISLENFRQDVTIPVERYFLDRPPDDEGGDGEVIDAIVAGQIDLGEVVAETLALELDPYPRKPGEEFASEEPVPDGGSVSAFASLDALKARKIERK